MAPARAPMYSNAATLPAKPARQMIQRMYGSRVFSARSPQSPGWGMTSRKTWAKGPSGPRWRCPSGSITWGLRGTPQYPYPRPETGIVEIGGEFYFDDFTPGHGFIRGVDVSLAPLPESDGAKPDLSQAGQTDELAS